MRQLLWTCCFFLLPLQLLLSQEDRRKKIIVPTEKEKRAAQLRIEEEAAKQDLFQGIAQKNNLQVLAAQQKIAQINIEKERPDSAVVYLLAAVKLAEKTNPSNILRADIFRQLGDVFFNEKLYKNAIVYYDSVLLLTPKNYEVIEKIGDSYLRDGRLLAAEQSYQPLLDKLSAEGNMFRVVEIYQKIVLTCNQLNMPKNGISYYKIIQGIVERVGSAEEKASLYNNLGYQYFLVGDSQNAIQFLTRAKEICDDSKCGNLEVYLINLGIVQHNSLDNKAGIQNLLSAIKILSDKKNTVELARVKHITAQTYFAAHDYYNALSHNNEAMNYAKESRRHDVWRNTCKTAAEIYLELYDHENAIEFYREYLRLDDSLRMVDQNTQKLSLQKQSLLERTEKTTQLLIRENTIQDLYQERIQREQDNLKLANQQLTFVAKQKQDSLIILQKEQDLSQQQQLIAETEIKRKTLEILQINQQLKFEAQQRAAERELLELTREQELERTRQLAKDSLAARDLESLKQAAEISDLKLQQQENFRKYVTGLGLVLGLILAMLGAGWYFARKTNRRLAIQKNLIERERAKSDSLLRNILPEEIAEELKQNGLAKPRQYEQVTVLFTDFVNFTKLSQTLTAAELIDELNECFLAFDLISERHQMEKIKTIGDAYMCAGGVPIPNATSPINAVAAAIEMFDWLRKRTNAKGKTIFREMRIGIHTGPVIAGVVGKNKFAYDIWGDAVNLAARLEEFGAPGEINISGATYALIQDYYACDYRGKKMVRNKGEIDMYFVKQDIDDV